MLLPHDELVERVLAAGGIVRERLSSPCFAAVDAKDLLAPHNPFHCAPSARFQVMLERNPALSEIRVGEIFRASLTEDDRAS
jgi:hypothetical protein